MSDSSQGSAPDEAELGERLCRWLAEPLRGPVRVDGLTRLAGGSSRDLWSFDATAAGRVHRLVLRRDPPAADDQGMRREAAVLAAARAAGVPVPAVVATAFDARAVGAPALVMERVDGETLPRQIRRDPRLAAARSRFAAQSGEILAAIHAIPTEAVPGLGAQDPLEWCEQTLSSLDVGRPALELALGWLRAHRPGPTTARPVVLHGDFRLGNLMVGPGGIASVLDWELVHAGDPLEDLTWLCTKAWRFGGTETVAGLGTRDQLCAAYTAATGTEVDPERWHWWEVLSALKWAVMCVNQSALHLSGRRRSVELVAVGRRTCEAEWDLLHLLYGPDPGPVPVPRCPGAPRLLDPPAGGSLIAAVREFLLESVLPATGDRLGYDVRVAATLLGIAEREADHGAAARRAAATLLDGLGVGSTDELAEGLRTGTISPTPDAVSAVRGCVRLSLQVANPRYLSEPFLGPEVTERTASCDGQYSPPGSPAARGASPPTASRVNPAAICPAESEPPGRYHS
ncbi:phosphotransferase [Pseudonocardia sp. RS010]|uniref:phosphotransferase n=1 Tax=Pseudonocardia sp. RS010 TaxID=3385979 RepID=UPI0039A01794